MSINSILTFNQHPNPRVAQATADLEASDHFQVTLKELLTIDFQSNSPQEMARLAYQLDLLFRTMFPSDTSTHFPRIALFQLVQKNIFTSYQASLDDPATKQILNYKYNTLTRMLWEAQFTHQLESTPTEKVSNLIASEFNLVHEIFPSFDEKKFQELALTILKSNNPQKYQQYNNLINQQLMMSSFQFNKLNLN
jgi:hypothetical protein